MMLSSAHEQTQSLLSHSAVTFSKAKEQYQSSLRCLLQSLAALPREQQLTMAALAFLHVVVPLGLLAFDEARIVLQWALLQYALMHALMHFTSQWHAQQRAAASCSLALVSIDG